MRRLSIDPFVRICYSPRCLQRWRARQRVAVAMTSPRRTSRNIGQLSSPRGPALVETTEGMNGTDYVHEKVTLVEALTALTQIYAQMQIPIAMMVPDAGQIGNQKLTLATHRLHGHLISFYLNCGQESMIGSRADLDEVTISVLTNVRRSRDSLTVVGTTVQGWARPSGTSSNAVDCETTGELERGDQRQQPKPRWAFQRRSQSEEDRRSWVVM